MGLLWAGLTGGTAPQRDVVFALTPEYLARLRAAIDKLPPEQRWVAGETSFLGSLMPVAERAEVLAPLAAVALAKRVPPVAVDLLTDGWVDPPECQGAVGACAAFALVAVAEATARRVRDDPTLPSLSEKDLYEGVLASTGTTDDAKIYRTHLQEVGVRRRCEPTGAAPTVTRASGYREFRWGDWDEMRAWIADRGPLLAIMVIYADFLLYRAGIYRPVLRDALGMHAVAVVGYDDERQAWRCRNSFGCAWGEEGCFWVPYCADNSGLDAAMWGITGFHEIAGGS